MNQIINSKRYDLEERTLDFAKKVRLFIKIVPKTITNFEDLKQLVRSSGSVGANYIEANESLSKKDFLFRVKIAKKETKETKFWLELIDLKNNKELEKTRIFLINETMELMKIFGSIIEKAK
jgi:four helix bundle protein